MKNKTFVDKLNSHQKRKDFHPFTCGKNHTDSNHLDGEGVLVATENGWICPFCDYTQPFGDFEEKIVEFLIFDTND